MWMLRAFDGHLDGFVRYPVFEYIRFGLHCLFVVALVALIVVLIVRALKRHKQGPTSPMQTPPPPPSVDAALKILNERYVRGEVDDETYRRMKDELLKP
jgi:uncharacterized membrane protein